MTLYPIGYGYGYGDGYGTITLRRHLCTSSF